MPGRLVAWFDGGPKDGQTMWLRSIEDPLFIFDRTRIEHHAPTAAAKIPLVTYRLQRVVGNVAFYVCADPPCR